MNQKISIDSTVRILVVDDQPFIRNMVRAILKGFGINEVTTADDGIRAMEYLQEAPFDIVICDWNMPGMAGIDVLKTLRASGHGCNTPFIMLTAEAYRENIIAALDAGVTDYISKPFTPDVLGEKISKSLSKNRST